MNNVQYSRLSMPGSDPLVPGVGKTRLHFGFGGRIGQTLYNADPVTTGPTGVDHQ